LICVTVLPAAAPPSASAVHSALMSTSVRGTSSRRTP
jgi:hypothetical protein